MSINLTICSSASDAVKVEEVEAIGDNWGPSLEFKEQLGIQGIL